MNDALEIDVYDVLDKLGIENVRAASGGSEVNYSCPFSGHAHGDERPSAYMNVDTSAWFCQGCKERGRSAVSFVAKMLGIEYAVAARFLREAYGVDFHEPDGGSMLAETAARFAPLAEFAPLRRPDPSWQDGFRRSFALSPAYEYISGRGLWDETIEDWGLGYDTHSNRLTIPVHDLDGELVGFKGRALSDDHNPKYLILGDRVGSRHPHYGFDPYEASEVVFGLHRNRDVRESIVSEGELNAIVLAQHGQPRPVATGMSYFSDRHAMLLIRECERVIAFYDGDKSGRAGIWGHEKTASGVRLPGMVERLQLSVLVQLVEDHEGDPMSLSSELCSKLIDSARSSLAYTTVFG